ncbi:MAG: hypothetical protein ACRCXT_16755 [Paraclostridium sp.]
MNKIERNKLKQIELRNCYIMIDNNIHTKTTHYFNLTDKDKSDFLYFKLFIENVIKNYEKYLIEFHTIRDNHIIRIVNLENY